MAVIETLLEQLQATLKTAKEEKDRNTSLQSEVEAAVQELEQIHERAESEKLKIQARDQLNLARAKNYRDDVAEVTKALQADGGLALETPGDAGYEKQFESCEDKGKGALAEAAQGDKAPEKQREASAEWLEQVRDCLNKLLAEGKQEESTELKEALNKVKQYDKDTADLEQLANQERDRAQEKVEAKQDALEDGGKRLDEIESKIAEMAQKAKELYNAALSDKKAIEAAVESKNKAAAVVSLYDFKEKYMKLKDSVSFGPGKPGGYDADEPQVAAKKLKKLWCDQAAAYIRAVEELVTAELEAVKTQKETARTLAEVEKRRDERATRALEKKEKEPESSAEGQEEAEPKSEDDEKQQTGGSEAE